MRDGNDGKSDSNLWTPGRVVATIAVVGLIAALGFTFLGRSARNDARLVLPGTSAAEGATTPLDVEIPTMEGHKIKMSDYRGKVVVVDFWATWCPPCRKEIPQLTRMARTHRDKGLEVIGLHVEDGKSSDGAIRAFMEQYGINYTVGKATNELFVAYLGEQETAIPQTLVFGRDGKLVEHLIGYSEPDASKLDAAVNRALAAY